MLSNQADKELLSNLNLSSWHRQRMLGLYFRCTLWFHHKHLSASMCFTPIPLYFTLGLCLCEYTVLFHDQFSKYLSVILSLCLQAEKLSMSTFLRWCIMKMLLLISLSQSLFDFNFWLQYVENITKYQLFTENTLS